MTILLIQNKSADTFTNSFFEYLTWLLFGIFYDEFIPKDRLRCERDLNLSLKEEIVLWDRMIYKFLILCSKFIMFG